MKNTSILIPIILIGCLVALIYLFFAALQATGENANTGPDRIVLNPADYTDDPLPGDIGQDADFEPYFQEVPEDEKVMPGEEGPTDGATDGSAAGGVPSTGGGGAGTSGIGGRTQSTGAVATATTVATGRYLVIAGSFRQMDNGQQRVRDLKAAGFKDTRLEKFNRGTFAVALAGQSNRYSEANRLAEKVKAAGFEAKVMRRR